MTSKPSSVHKAKKIDYNRDIRPIITKCFACHGHDSKTVEAKLRLDQRDTATEKLPSKQFAIVPFHPEKSELVDRINAKNALRMPPRSSNKTLSDDEKRLLTQWIAEGAEYKQHWAFVRPIRPAVPVVKQKAWPRNPIDNFILSRLEEEGLTPSPEADKRTLIRRATLDLLGVPPKKSDVDAFVADKSKNAYEKVVDRLLASPQYGERMAMDWLDYARYADSNGFQSDYERFQYRWRDWVIDAYNKNMPFDEFTVEQLAGDLLPHPTTSQITATGFNRNNRVNTEGGIIDEEWRVEMVIDRVETTCATWLGLTAGCCRCHDHKYDPLTQKDFYSLNSYFSNIPEAGAGVDAAVNQVPFIKAPYPEQESKLKSLNARLAAVQKQSDLCLAADTPKAMEWNPSGAIETPMLNGEVARFQFGDKVEAKSCDPSAKLPTPVPVGKYTAELGRATGAIVTDGNRSVDLGKVGNFDGTKPFSYGGWINPKTATGSPIAKMDVKNAFRGYDLFFQGNRLAAHFINRWPENSLKVVAKPMIPLNEWSHVVVTNDGSRKPEGIHFYINGRPVEFEVETNALTETIQNDVPLSVGRRSMGDSFDGMVDTVQIFDRVVTADEAVKLADVSPGAPILRVPQEKRTASQKKVLASLWADLNDPTYHKLQGTKKSLESDLAKLDADIPTVSVMQEMAKPRDCYVLIRGQYDKHGAKVTARTPKFLPPTPKGYPNNRLGLAKWIVDPSNPLTARVAVNRLWERFFGVGIVATTEDFGTRAEFPSHPELLDWLATEFVGTGWNMKHLVKEILTSATYRQSSTLRPEVAKRDPANRLLARGPRLRLPGEVIRDQALAAAGLLVPKIGGKSVKPYQPAGIWNETAAFGNLVNYQHDMGEGLYRRSMYTLWKRTAAPPQMLLFDVPSREICRVGRSRTNTPLQALVLLNDVTFVEAARVFGQRMIKEGGSDAKSRIDFAFQTLLARHPTSQESQIMLAGLNRRLQHYRTDTESAKKLVSLGEAPADKAIPTPELAAYTITASAILNLDETLNKQ